MFSRIMFDQKVLFKKNKIIKPNILNCENAELINYYFNS